jgi:hypothetical protein
MKRRLLSSLLYLAVFGICQLTLAATFREVSNVNDSGQGSLRQAILDANSVGGNNIIKITTEGTIELSDPLPIVAGFPRLNLIIRGPGAGVLTVDGRKLNDRIFSVVDTATIIGMTITKGGNGAISNVGHLTLQDCVITDNTAHTGAGAIFNTGTLKVINCTISKNVVRGETNFRDGAADGGAIVNGGDGTAKILNSTLNGNAAFGAPPPHGSTGSHASGGAIKNLSNGTVTLINSTVSGNVARGGDTGVFLSAFNSAGATEEDAKKYYAIVDPDGKRDTLGKWWRVNNFDQNGKPLFRAGKHAAYFNNNDLGFGRDTTIQISGDDDFGVSVASWLANYSLTPPYPDQNPLSADAALARDPGRGIAAVCMEKSSGNGLGRIVKFFVYDGVGPNAQRQLSADLDGYGKKPVPYLCTTCHGGQLPTNPTYSNVQNMNSFFREFDLASFKFPRPGFPVDHPIRSSPDTPEQIKFFEMNNLVLATNPSPAIKELIKGWYRNSPLGQFQDPNFVPPGWQRHPDNPNLDGEVKQLYQQVIATSCRTCHIAGASSSPPFPDFSTFASFSAVASLVKTNVFQYNNAPTPRLATMPHAMIAFKNFWKTENPHRPTMLANALTRLTDVFSPPEFDGNGANGGSARGGGIDNENGKVTIAASTIAFNTASGGIGFNAIKNNGQLDVSSSIGMGDAGGVFSETFSTTLHSSITAENFSDTDHFTDNIALRRDDILGSFHSEDFNLIGASHEFLITGATAHNQIDVANPGLGLLRNNGGPTFTHALLGGSPAIDSGDNRILDLVTTDQRGFGRKVGNAVDIGAFEFGGTERDLSSEVRVTRGGFYFNRNTQRYVQQVTIQNISGTTIDSPLRLALDGLTNNVALWNKDGIHSEFGNIPFVSINIGNDNIFSAGESVSVTLEFTDPFNIPIMYTPRVLEVVPVP